MNTTIPFLIDHLDPLGQGVSRRSDTKGQSIISFLPKTLPQEQGTAKVIKSAKGVEFAELIAITQTASQRITPECVHYAQCPGCDYLHISYADEIAYKKSALLFLMRAFSLQDDRVEVIPASQRLGYRNRVQLHYRHKYMGLVDANSGQVLEIPECRLLCDELKPLFDNLYQDKSWSKEHSGSGKSPDGHCELSMKDKQPHLEWDAPYASGGFTQVNEQMNEKLRHWLQTRFATEKFSSVLDLFSGNGNLSNVLNLSDHVKRVMVDSTAQNHPDFIKLDLLEDDALDRFVHRSKAKVFDLLLIDPPRKGFAKLSDWEKKLKPKWIVYVSCNPATLARDLQLLMKSNNKLKIKDVVLLDMFPATRHFETIVVLKG